MRFFRLGVELEGANIEIDLIIRVRCGAVDRAREARVLEALGEPRPEQPRQRLRPARARERGERERRFANKNVCAVEIGRRGRLADADLRS